MARQVVSRTQRRMEKKQAMILLVLVLAVSLVSFTLGVMVGRGGSRTTAAAEPEPSPARLSVAQVPPTQKPESAPADAAAPKPGPESLTFYDTLPKGEQPPMGSGINLPPAQEAAAQVKEAASEQKVSATQAAPPPAASGGSYVVQAASFRQAEEARSLQARLADKAYAAFTEEADLKEKGVWHRVYIGPFATSAAAAEVVARLKAEERLSALVKRR